LFLDVHVAMKNKEASFITVIDILERKSRKGLLGFLDSRSACFQIDGTAFAISNMQLGPTLTLEIMKPSIRKSSWFRSSIFGKVVFHGTP